MPFEEVEDQPEQPETKSRSRNPDGRPTILQPTEDTFKQINGLARIQCTQREAAAVLGVHRDTFTKFLNTHEKAMEAWEDGGETGKASLRRMQFKNADSGNATMQIWLGKQWLGQRDSLDTTTTVVASDAHLESRAAQLIGKARAGGDTGGDGAAEDAPPPVQPLP